MSPKEYLKTLMQFRERYYRACEDVEEIRELMASAGAIRYDKLNIQSSQDGDKMAAYMARLGKAESRAERLFIRYQDRFDQIREQLDVISPQIYSDVLYLRYVCNYSLWKIADEMNYSFQHIRRIHGLALAEFGRIFPEVLENAT